VNKEISDKDLIYKYYNGELSGTDMQKLEQRALDDPFLADAMEGFDEFPIAKNDLVDLTERLKDKTQSSTFQKKGIVSSFTYWSIAASTIILIGIFSIYLNQLEEENKPVILSENKEKIYVPKREDLILDTTSEESQELIKEKPQIDLNKSDDFNEQEEDNIAIVSVGSGIIADSLLEQSNVLLASSAKKMDAGKSIVTVSSADLGEKSTINEASTYANRAIIRTNKKGKVVDEKTNLELPGAQVLNKSTGNIVVTDKNGEFQISVTEQEQLVLSFLGYNTKEVNVLLKDSLLVSLLPKEKSATEISAIDKSTPFAGPSNGWGEFRKYLNNNDKLPTGETGAVVIEFIINPDGELSDFKIQRNLSKLADERAIKLIKDYGSWIGASDGIAQKIKVTIRFN